MHSHADFESRCPLLNGTTGPCSWPIDSNRIVEQMAATRCDVSRHCLSAERCTVVVSGGERCKREILHFEITDSIKTGRILFIINEISSVSLSGPISIII